MSVLIDDRRQSSMTTEIRVRNEASGKLKYQPSKHTQSMINYSITMRSVNSNLIADAEFNLVASRSAQAAVIKAIKEGKANVDISTPTTPGGGSDGGGSNPSGGTPAGGNTEQSGGTSQGTGSTQAATIRATQDRTAAARTTNCRRGNYPPVKHTKNLSLTFKIESK